MLYGGHFRISVYLTPSAQAVTDDTSGHQRVRLDKWLWAARFYKTRALAAEAIDAGRIEVNGERAKRSKLVQLGDRMGIRRPPFELAIVVTGVRDQRGSATMAAELYTETEASTKAREALSAQLRARGPTAFREKGRPGKKERRDIDRLRGRED